jgi:hypothetical protein
MQTGGRKTMETICLQIREVIAEFGEEQVERAMMSFLYKGKDVEAF